MSELLLSVADARYVFRGRRYLRLLHANFLFLPETERSRFVRRLQKDAASISDRHLEVLLSRDWRRQLTGAWLIAASRRQGFTDRIGNLLVASQLVYAGQGFCIALAADGSPAAAARLIEYLNVWLARPDCRFDQAWAMAALICIDRREGSSHAAPLLLPGGPWESWNSGAFPLDEQVQMITDALLVIAS